MKTILVTGGLGFIGANFIRYLLEDSDYTGRIVNLDKITYAANPDNMRDLAARYLDRYAFVHADICDEINLVRTVEAFEVDAICHFAAESHVDRSIVAPDDFIRTNVMGTFTLLEIARKFQNRIRLFHHVSTDEVFGSLGPEGYFTEKTPYDPSSPYSASKAASDHLVRAYHRTYGIPVTVSNCSNNYGPFQFPEKLIPLMILNAFAEKPLPVYGKGINVRDWLYVMDHCRAIWTVMTRGVKGETYAVGGRCEMPNIEVVRMICDLTDEMVPPGSGRSRRALITYVKDRPGHDLRYAIDCARMEQELGWKPEETFQTGLKKTIRWYHDHPEWVARVTSGGYRDWIATQYGGPA